MNIKIGLILAAVTFVPGCALVGNTFKAVGEIAEAAIDAPKALLGIKSSDEVREGRLRSDIADARREAEARQEQVRVANQKVEKLENIQRQMLNCLPYSGSGGVMAVVIDDHCDRRNF